MGYFFYFYVLLHLMNFIPTPIADLWIIEPKVFVDERGYFAETFKSQALAQQGLSYSFIQDNEARSTRGVLRGLHYQKGSAAQAKLVRALAGEILDVAVDLRAGSPTYGQHFGIQLSSENKRQLLVPRGFAHGYSVLSETAVVLYKVDNHYDPSAEAGVRFDDPQLNIDWMLDADEIVLSSKDKILPLLQDVHPE